MKNNTQTELEIVLEYLNHLAEYFEQDNLTAKEFESLCYGAIGFANFNNSIDRIEERLLRAQAQDISKKEYSRFSDPDLDFANEALNEGFDRNGYPLE